MTFDIIGRGILFRNEDVMICLFFLCILMQIPLQMLAAHTVTSTLLGTFQAEAA